MPAETANRGRWLGIAALIFIAAAFSFLNAGERVSLHLGFTVLYRVSLVGLIFVVFLMGMVTMFLFGIRQDRRIRAILRDRALGSPPRPPTTHTPPPDQI
jgi:hypothetical protein